MALPDRLDDLAIEVEHHDALGPIEIEIPDGAIDTRSDFQDRRGRELALNRLLDQELHVPVGRTRLGRNQAISAMAEEIGQCQKRPVHWCLDALLDRQFCAM